jgi:hypothetical protein
LIVCLSPDETIFDTYTEEFISIISETLHMGSVPPHSLCPKSGQESARKASDLSRHSITLLSSSIFQQLDGNQSSYSLAHLTERVFGMDGSSHILCGVGEAEERNYYDRYEMLAEVPLLRTLENEPCQCRRYLNPTGFIK